MSIVSAPLTPRRIVAGTVAVVGTVVWSHAITALIRSAAGISAEVIAPAGHGLTVAAALAAAAGIIGYRSAARSSLQAGGTALLGAITLAIAYPAAVLPVLALVPVAAGFAPLGAWIARRLPASLDQATSRRPVLALAWLLLALVSVAQVGRLSTYVTDGTSDWFLTTRHPFYARHDCANAYFYGAEMALNGEANVYDPQHYPGLNRDAEPRTAMVGMTPEDPYQYAPQFLLWPAAAVSLSHDYQAIKALWYGVNVTLCMAAVLLLATFVGGGAGLATALLTPAILMSFPVLHNFQYGQFHFAAIALAVLSLLAIQSGRARLGGALLAVSILSKLFPAVLLIPLAVQRRWRSLGWTVAVGMALTGMTLASFGTAPFVAFFGHHLPRLADGSAFAFGDAWPELNHLVIAGNQGIHGTVHKLAAMGVPGLDDRAAQAAGKLYALFLLLLGIAVGLRTRTGNRSTQALAWLGFLGLASLASSGAWADYVPLTCVWLLALWAPMSVGRPARQAALAICALLQVFLLGALPLGDWTGPEWMWPVSLLGALAMLGTFAGATLSALRSRGPAENHPRRRHDMVAETQGGLAG